MLKYIKHYLEVLKYSAVIAIKSEMEYISYTLCWLLMIPIQLFSGVYVLKVILDRVGTLNGWSFGQVAFLYGLGVFSHGLQDLFFIQTRHIEYSIIHGELDRFLVRPLGVFFQFCVGTVNFVGIYDLIPGIIIFAYGCIQVNFRWNIQNIVMLILVIAGGTLIQAAIFTLTGSIAFWTKKSAVFVGINLQLLDKTTQWPMAIYPHWFIRIFSFLIPMGFVSFYPACGLLGISSGVAFPLPLEIPILTPIVGLVWFMLARKVFYIGLKKKYESAGS